MKIDRPVTACEVEDYTIVVVGHLRCNPYFGEKPEQPPRGFPLTCTSTLIRGTDADGKLYRLLIDPTERHTADDYYFDLNRRTGLRPEHITHIFCTHEDFDHVRGLNYFPDAQWLAPESVADALAHSEDIDGSRVIRVSGEFLPGLYAVHLPGHSMSLHGVWFRHGGYRVLVASDAVMTKHHFWNVDVAKVEDRELAIRSVTRAGELAELIIPGHDDLILNMGGVRA